VPLDIADKTGNDLVANCKDYKYYHVYIFVGENVVVFKQDK
tara:strand:+ start:2463 stop:2585 length:123 start_codon:yes stop_codon:yes gene_type:complete